MKNQDLWKSEQQINNLFDLAKKLDANPEMLGHWTRYLCIQVAGLVETSVQTLYSEYAHATSNPRVARYVEDQLGYVQNPNMERIMVLARSFEPEWAKELEETLEDKSKEAVNSIMSNRNRIAHGRNVSLSYGDIRRFYEGTLDVLNLIEDQCTR